jgi:hypothetical protein
MILMQNCFDALALEGREVELPLHAIKQFASLPLRTETDSRGFGSGLM